MHNSIFSKKIKSLKNKEGLFFFFLIFSSSGLYCEPVWDQIMCWEATTAGTMATARCPTYIEGLDTEGECPAPIATSRGFPAELCWKAPRSCDCPDSRSLCLVFSYLLKSETSHDGHDHRW